MRRLLHIHLYISIFFLFGSCSEFGAGFGSYGKPSKRSNKYYNKHFELKNTNLNIAKPYKNLDGVSDFYFVFYSNGFVLHNSIVNQDNLGYSKIHREDVGSYITKGDTVFWGTRPGYKKKNEYYSALITTKGLMILSKPDYITATFLTLQ